MTDKQEPELWRVAFYAFAETQDKRESIADAWRRVVDRVLAAAPPAQPADTMEHDAEVFKRGFDAGQAAQPAPAQEQEIEELTALCNRLSDLLMRTAAALKGPPDPLTLHDWADLPDVAADVAAVARLKPYATAPAQEPHPLTTNSVVDQKAANVDDKPAQRLSDDRIMELRDGCFVGAHGPNPYFDKLKFARAIEAAICPPSHVVVKDDPVAWEVYNAQYQSGYLVDSLDDAQLVDDLTNCRGVTVTPLYAANRSQP